MSSKTILEVLKVAQDAYRILGIRSVEEDVLRETWKIMRDRVEEVASATVKAMMECDRVVKLVREAGMTEERARNALSLFLELCMSGKFDEEQVKRMFRIGLAHARSGITVDVVLSTAYRLIIESFTVMTEMDVPPDRFSALSKSILWATVIVIYSYQVARRMSLSKAVGIPKTLVDKLFRLKADEIYRELAREVELKPGQP